MGALYMDPQQIEKEMPKAVHKQLVENAKIAAEDYFFCNTDEDCFPKDIWKALEKAGDSPAYQIKGVIVYEPYEYYSASDLLAEMKSYMDDRYRDMRDALGVYLAVQNKERSKSNETITPTSAQIKKQKSKDNKNRSR